MNYAKALAIIGIWAAVCFMAWIEPLSIIFVVVPAVIMCMAILES